MEYLRKSAVPYLALLVTAAMLGAYGNYLAPLAIDGGVTIKGQSLGIVIPIVLFPVAAALWVLYRGKASRAWWLQAFLTGLILSWIIHFAITGYHRDMYVHTVWLFIPVVLMIMLKTPDSAEAWQALVILAWLAAVILIVTRTLELLNVVPQWFYPTPSEAQWEREHYWLPFAGHFGIASRWPGPFGFNSKTGFVAVLLLVIGLARWRKISSPVFIVVGVLCMLLTGGRGVYLSALAGVLVLVLFSRWRFMNRVPTTIRVSLLFVAVAFVAYKFASSSTATTGRAGEGGIWDAFLALWRTSPWIGVGQIGIWNAPNRARVIMDAHSIFVQELAQFGIVGFVCTYTTLFAGLAITGLAAVRAWSGPLAVLTIYFIAGTTDLLHSSWELHNLHTLMFIFAVVSAAAWLHARRIDATSEVETDMW